MYSIQKGLKQSVALTLFLLDYATEYGIRNGLKRQEGLELNGICRPLGYANGVNLLDANVPP
jgi:hypothetical protein